MSLIVIPNRSSNIIRLLHISMNKGNPIRVGPIGHSSAKFSYQRINLNGDIDDCLIG